MDYPLEEDLLLCLLAVPAAAETISGIALFGCKKPDLLRRFKLTHRQTVDGIVTALRPEP